MNALIQEPCSDFPDRLFGDAFLRLVDDVFAGAFFAEAGVFADARDVGFAGAAFCGALLFADAVLRADLAGSFSLTLSVTA